MEWIELVVEVPLLICWYWRWQTLAEGLDKLSAHQDGAAYFFSFSVSHNKLMFKLKLIKLKVLS